ncbi:MAG: YkgJ family cysteine cluster protein [Allosphingosinicella sp.]
MFVPMGDDVNLPGRSCGSCTLCCKMFRIDSLAKPRDEWCRHCAIGRGCTIYDSRPVECRRFHCGYLFWPQAGEHWFPGRSKMIIVSEMDGTLLSIHVDPARPDAWRQAPYHADIRQWAAWAAPAGHRVTVFVGRRAIVIFPDRDVDLGILAEDERTLVLCHRTPAGMHLEALKVKADDPRLSSTAREIDPSDVARRTA